MGDSGEGDMCRPLLKGVPVDAEAEVTGKGHEIGILPWVVHPVGTLFYCLSFLFQPFCLQCRHPWVDGQCRQVGDNLVTGWILVGTQQFLVVLPDRGRDFQLHLWDVLSFCVCHLAIRVACDMQHDIVVSLVFVMSMQIPVARLVVNLHVTHPECLVDFHFSIEEIRSTVVIMQSGVNHLDGSAVRRLEFS